MPRRSSILLCLLAYGLCLAVVVGVMWQARQRALAELDTAQARQQWDSWRTAARQQSDGQGPVVRRAPQSDEQPGLVLLRDYFATALLGVLCLTSALFVTLWLLIRGVLAGPRFEVGKAEEGAPD